ncbi:MAG: valine--tRNA ligase [Bacteriovoracaceae bacterium]|nr:valine--tRNA ligase [Bacteriovoracaceae bacterium]
MNETTQELTKVFSPAEIEKKWYPIWMENKSFKPKKGKKKETFTIIMPPPNVTGKLHMGHALDQTCQDVLIRHRRMSGYETLWVPGVDHAGISTQAVVEKKIYQEEKKTKHDLGREAFVKKIWEWKEQFGSEITHQLKKIGISCDWDYFTFTMDDVPNQSVRKAFVQLYNEGLIYQADYIVNWDPILQSAISDAEVEHKEVKGAYYFLKYKVKDSDETLEVATTRPETLFGDTAVAVNPADERFKHLIGKTAIIPLCEREVTIIGDEHVDIEKGTGCLKVTPGHDFNDFEIGKRHNLKILNILNKDGTLNENGMEFQGLTCAKARKKVVEKLTELNLLIKTEEVVHQVGHGQRSDEIVEPMVSKQWFLNVQDMAKVAVEAIESEKTKFFPKTWENTYFSWLREPKNWCISRQLWWGHQIPVYYCGDCKNTWANEDKPSSCPKCKSTSFEQDPDVLDTWFSSGLFPLNTLGWPNKEAMEEKRFKDFYPTATLVTGFDIIFFWVARMMMMCTKFTGKVPFDQIYIHGIVRDKQGRKMSKSLGNGIDPLELIEKYGADAMRFTLAAGSGYNRGLNLDPERIEGYRNFINKVWNAFRFIQPHLVHAQETLPSPNEFTVHDKWILSELNTVAKSVNESLYEYRFDDASSAIYQFVYEVFCSWYIELSKNIFNSENDNAKVIRASVLKYCFREILALLHPFIPYITEELWESLKKPNEPLLIDWTFPEFNDKLVYTREQESMNKFIEVITSVRNLRASVNLKPKDEINVEFFTDDAMFAEFLYSNRAFMKDLARISAGKIRNKSEAKPKKSVMAATSFCEIFVPLEGLINLQEQITRIEKEIAKTQKDYDIYDRKLQNEKFVNSAPAEVVAETKQKANEFKEKLVSLQESLANFQ